MRTHINLHQHYQLAPVAWVSAVSWVPYYVRACVLFCFICVWLFAAPWTVAPRLLCPWGFSRQEHWSVFPCTPPGDHPDPGIEPVFLMSPPMAGRFFTNSVTWEAQVLCFHLKSWKQLCSRSIITLGWEMKQLKLGEIKLANVHWKQNSNPSPFFCQCLLSLKYASPKRRPNIVQFSEFFLGYMNYGSMKVQLMKMTNCLNPVQPTGICQLPLISPVIEQSASWYFFSRFSLIYFKQYFY